MLTRLHISSFIALTIAIWLGALWFQGAPVLSIAFIKPFSIVVGAIVSIVALFNKYAWSWGIFRGWYVNRPDLRGTWQVTINSSWVNQETGKPTDIIVGYAVIRQSLTSLSLRLMTSESRSKLIAYSIEQEEDDLFRLAGIYCNEPKIDLQGDRSEIHHGALSLNIYGQPVTSIEGHYWTDRATKGSIKFANKKGKVCDTFENAQSEFDDKKV